MKSFAQGDLHFTAIKSIPKMATRCVKPEHGQLILGHSETGHHHVMAADHVTMYEDENPLICYLYVEQPAALEHLRSFDTHVPITVPAGKYEVRRQREYVPEGFRRVED